MKPVRRILSKRKSAACIRSLLLILVVLLCLSAPSCRRDPSVDAALLDKAEQAANKPALPHDAEEYTGDWAPETVYSPGDLSDIEGIRYIHAPLANSAGDGMWYCRVCTFQQYRREDSEGTSWGTAWLHKVVNLETGEDRAICPDPLCKHIREECPYVDLNSLAYADGALYVLRDEFTHTGEGESIKLYWISTIERLDPSTGAFAELVRIGDKATLDEENHILTNVSVENGKLRYKLLTQTTDRENKTTGTTGVFVLADAETGRTIKEIPIPQDLIDAEVSILRENADGFLCSDTVNGLYRTDGAFQNREKIGSDVDCERIGLNAVDTVTGEIFLDLYTPLTAEQRAAYRQGTRRLGRLVGDEVEEIPLPRNDLIEVYVTRNWIYYTAADLVSVGPGRHGEAGFEDGGVIYRVPRDDPSAEPQTVFTDGVNFNMREWFVLGDCLYLGSWERFEEDGAISFGRTVKGVRLNLKDHTVRYIRYE